MATISRKELYKKVWETPITRLSKEYGLSDTGMDCIRQTGESPAIGIRIQKEKSFRNSY